jgi:hypothetical protein
VRLVPGLAAMRHEVALTTPCRCGHLALDHHFSGYRGDKGEAGRGACSRNTAMAMVDHCTCVSFEWTDAEARVS